MIVYRLQYRPFGTKKWKNEDRISGAVDEQALIRNWLSYIKDLPSWANQANERVRANWRVLKVHKTEHIRT